MTTATTEAAPAIPLRHLAPHPEAATPGSLPHHHRRLTTQLPQGNPAMTATTAAASATPRPRLAPHPAGASAATPPGGHRRTAGDPGNHRHHRRTAAVRRPRSRKGTLR
ncbi:hypothetical protein OHT57_06080 [Streptomyces sp. NBC_00285]|uniref:hypothetical protein n=1 Tax=Streptomyces sp. NBC_00285 TaxID=2975700 RepID=UPI002E292DDA|nr:hypothetical protein [Streptomyces sp. NBC_00285]